MNVSPLLMILPGLLCLVLSGCYSSAAHENDESHEEAHHKIIVTSPAAKDVITTQKYVCQIHSRRHIELRALEGGYLEEITIKEGQGVKQGEILFRILPVLFKAEFDSEMAEAQQAQIKYDNCMRLLEKGRISQQEL